MRLLQTGTQKQLAARANGLPEPLKARHLASLTKVKVPSHLYARRRLLSGHPKLVDQCRVKLAVRSDSIWSLHCIGVARRSRCSSGPVGAKPPAGPLHCFISASSGELVLFFGHFEHRCQRGSTAWPSRDSASLVRDTSRFDLHERETRRGVRSLLDEATTGLGR